MSKTYTELMKKPKGTRNQMRLIIKNGITYKIIIESLKKPKYKRLKPFKNKRWIINNVKLLDFNINNQQEIESIIKANEDEQKSYDSCFAMEKDQYYKLLLSNKQYTILRNFLINNDIIYKTPFSFYRSGKGFKTHLTFIRQVSSKKGK